MVNAEARIKQHTSRRLKPGEMFSVHLRATVYSRPETWQEALKRVSQQDGMEGC
jgi:hypothetical protein